MMEHSFKKVRLKTLYFQAVTVYPNGDTYLRYYSKLQKCTNIDSLDWYSVIINDKKGKPKRWIRLTPELQEQLIQTVKYRKEIRKPKEFKITWKNMGDSDANK
jgi:hypothetical protein